MKKDIRVGLIGFGAMGKTHAFAIQNLPYFFGDLPFRSKIAGVATRSMEKSAKAAELYGLGLATDNEAELIHSPDIDVIDICTPNICHIATAKAALAAGKHLYCEKPLAATFAEATEMADLAEKSGLICTAVFNNRHLSAVRKAKQLIDEGRLGRILHFEFQYLHNSCTDPEKTAGWKQDATVCGAGGVLFDLGSHILDLAVYLCGEMTSVYGKSQVAYPTRKGTDGNTWQTNAPEAFYMTVTAKSGAVGTLTASKLTTGANDDLSFAIYGERGALRFSLMDLNFLYFYDATAPASPYGGERGFTKIECVGRYDPPAGSFPSPKAPAGWLRGHTMSLYRFLNAVYTGVQNSPTFRDAAYVQYLMELALASAADGKEKEACL